MITDTTIITKAGRGCAEADPYRSFVSSKIVGREKGVLKQTRTGVSLPILPLLQHYQNWCIWEETRGRIHCFACAEDGRDTSAPTITASLTECSNCYHYVRLGISLYLVMKEYTWKG